MAIYGDAPKFGVSASDVTCSRDSTRMLIWQHWRARVTVYWGAFSEGLSFVFMGFVVSFKGVCVCVGVDDLRNFVSGAS